MRLQTLYLPSPVGDAQPRFALIADQVEPLDSAEGESERAAAFFEFARDAGAAAAFMTDTTVEQYDPTPVDDEPPTRPMVIFPEHWQKACAQLAAGLRARMRAQESTGRPR